MTELKDPTNALRLLPGRAGVRGRPDGITPILIVCHIQEGFNDLPSYFATIDADSTMWIETNGKSSRMLLDTDTPYTNGNWSNPDLSNPVIASIHPKYPNPYCLTIEHQGKHNGSSDFQFPPKQLEASAQMIAYWCQTWDIPADANHIVPHASFDSDTRKRCPGTGYKFALVIARVNEILATAQKPFDPNPQKLKVGQGVLEFAKERKLFVTTNEQYYQPAGGAVGLAERSDTWATDTQDTFIIRAFQTLDETGQPAPQWDIRLTQEI